EPLTGVVLALSSAASILAGLAYGSLRRAPTPEVVQLLAAAALTAAVAVGAIWPSLPGLVAMLVVGGTAIAPLLASSSQVVEASVAAGELTQGFTWINTASAAGIAASAALTGALVTTAGTRTAVAALLGLVLVATAAAGIAVRAARAGGARAS
ncbi:MFS transporter, partial [Clavibacter lycopersici]